MKNKWQQIKKKQISLQFNIMEVINDTYRSIWSSV